MPERPLPAAALRATPRPWRFPWPAPLAIDARERARVALGVAVGLLVAALLSSWLAAASWGGHVAGWPPARLATAWLMAPIGASAVLVFALPSSPLAQPWPVVGGSTASALVGVAVAHWLPGGAWAPLALAVAGGGAVLAMLALRCLHPPGGAAALLAVLAREAGGHADWSFVLFPVLVNVLLLVAAGIAYNRATGRAYPHADVRREPAAAGPQRVTDADIDRVLARRNAVLDLPRDELAALLEAAESEAHQRRLATLRASDIMTTDPVTVDFGTPLQEAWALLRARQIKALPVVDRTRRVVGIVTLADFLRGAELDLHQGFDERLKRWLRPTPAPHSDKPEAVGQIMTRQVRVASAQRSLAELVPIFSDTGHHHIPVIDDDGRLIGILTQTDLVRALLRESGD